MIRALLPLTAILLPPPVFAQPVGSLPARGHPAATADFAADARALETIVAAKYAYLDRLPGGRPPRSAALDALRDAVRDRRSLLAYAESVMVSLADHHAITGSSLADSWAVIPTNADLWIVRDAAGYRIDAVRDASPAARAGVRAGDRLIAVSGVPIATAIQGFWKAIGLATEDDDRKAFAARVLAAGRRDRARDLTISGARGERRFLLPTLYAEPVAGRPPVELTRSGDVALIRIANALDNLDTIAAFDAAMASIPRDAAVEVDLTDTPSGGNTTVARAILGWFVDRPRAYQIHTLPTEERETGVARQWVEQVLPRAGKHHRGPVTVRVGRWTGSMGEGLAIGFDAIGARVVGDPMAGLLGAIYDHRLPGTGLIVKLPTERLLAVDGTPREAFVPEPPARGRDR